MLFFQRSVTIPHTPVPQRFHKTHRAFLSRFFLYHPESPEGFCPVKDETEKAGAVPH